MEVFANYYFYMTGAYDLLYSAVYPMKYLGSDVMWYKIVILG